MVDRMLADGRRKHSLLRSGSILAYGGHSTVSQSSVRRDRVIKRFDLDIGHALSASSPPAASRAALTEDSKGAYLSSPVALTSLDRLAPINTLALVEISTMRLAGCELELDWSVMSPRSATAPASSSPVRSLTSDYKATVIAPKATAAAAATAKATSRTLPTSPDIHMRKHHCTGYDFIRGNPKRCIEFLRATTAALARLHAKGILHGDVYLDNIMVDGDVDGVLQVEFIDHDGSMLLLHPHMYHHCKYDARGPELWVPLDGPQPAYSVESEMWALGCTLFHALMLSGSSDLAESDFPKLTPEDVRVLSTPPSKLVMPRGTTDPDAARKRHHSAIAARRRRISDLSTSVNSWLALARGSDWLAANRVLVQAVWAAMNPIPSKRPSCVQLLKMLGGDASLVPSIETRGVRVDDGKTEDKYDSESATVLAATADPLVHAMLFASDAIVMDTSVFVNATALYMACKNDDAWWARTEAFGLDRKAILGLLCAAALCTSSVLLQGLELEETSTLTILADKFSCTQLLRMQRVLFEHLDGRVILLNPLVVYPALLLPQTHTPTLTELVRHCEDRVAFVFPEHRQLRATTSSDKTVGSDGDSNGSVSRGHKRPRDATSTENDSIDNAPMMKRRRLVGPTIAAVPAAAAATIITPTTVTTPPATIVAVS